MLLCRIILIHDRVPLKSKNVENEMCQSRSILQLYLDVQDILPPSPTILRRIVSPCHIILIHDCVPLKLKAGISLYLIIISKDRAQIKFEGHFEGRFSVVLLN